jgi:hypothetical protein
MIDRISPIDHLTMGILSFWRNISTALLVMRMCHGKIPMNKRAHNAGLYVISYVNHILFT